MIIPIYNTDHTKVIWPHFKYKVCYEIFEFKFSKIVDNVILHKFSKKCSAIEIFENHILNDSLSKNMFFK